jgi:predicted Zn-dependent peptidase
VSRTVGRRWYRSRYSLPSTVVVAAGGVDHARLLRLVRTAFGSLLDGDGVPAPVRSPSRPPAARSAVVASDRATEQANILIGTTALRRDDPRRPALHVLNTALGGGTSSRLFQSIREERALAYSVHSSVTAYADTGTFGVYAGCAPGKAREVLGLVREELDAVAARGLTDAEVMRAKGALRGSLVLDLEDTGARMSRLGKAALLQDELLSADELLDRIAAVTPDDVRAVAADVLTRPLALGAIGPFGDDDLAEVIR